MNSITKERIELFIKDPLENGLTRGEQMELARIALASLEAEPIGEVSEKRLGLVMDGTVDLGGKSTYRIIKGEKAMKLLPLGTKFYTAPPVPVVPEEKPMPNPLSMYTVDAVAAIAEVRGWNACRAAMLHGAEPVSQTYKLPPLSSNEVNDAAWKLRNMLTEHGHLNGRQFNNLKGCFYEALKVAMRNYPVTPDSWISCSDRMPNEEDVLVYCSDTKEQMVGFHKGKGLFQFFYMNGVEGVCEPSHWMRLPEPPQEVNRG
ncbi:hypothetical protein RG64_06455 [Escherichia coli]|jgi:hypothetical protein|nr:hypothetical protein RG64_06455 [Escherichia coli]